MDIQVSQINLFVVIDAALTVKDTAPTAKLGTVTVTLVGAQLVTVALDVPNRTVPCVEPKLAP